MARFSSSSSHSSSSSSLSYYGARATYNASSGKRSPSACEEVAVRYPNGVKTVIHHSNFRASAIARDNSDDYCKRALQRAVEVSLFSGPDLLFEFYQNIVLSRDCGIEVDVGSLKNGSSKKDSRSGQD